VPNGQLYVITCIDPRVDPAAILGLDLGDAIVARNVGGRVTASVLQDLAWISYLHETKTPDADWFDLVVVHHTDCGSGLLADDDLRHGFAARGYDEDELVHLPVLDPAATVRADVEVLRGFANLSPRVRTGGYRYDVATGRLDEVVPAQPRGE
jgi:carbonic anhydrase